MRLLTIGNPKTAKGAARGYLTAVLHLAPYKASGLNVCPMAELAGCHAGCLNTAGRGGIAAGRATFETPAGMLPDNAIQHARIARTRFFTEQREAFMAQLVREVGAFCRKARRKGFTPAVRLNGTSDIRWENVPAVLNGEAFPNIFAAYFDVQFYDYTKIPNRRELPANYHVSISYSRASPRYEQLAVDAARAQSRNLVAVFSTKRGAELPAHFLGLPVVDGDETDLRFLDPPGVVIGLRAKGAARRDRSGFVVQV